MNIRTLLLAFAAFTFISCSSTYKNTQTPDDVYYSPARTIKKDKRQDEVKRYDPEEREIRMSVYDSRWRTLNNRYNYGYNLSPYDFDYGYNSYNPYYNTYGNYGGYGGYHGYNSPYNYYGSGYYYNPYYASYPIYIVTPTTPVNRTPRKVNLSGYNQNNTQPISGIKTTTTNRNNNSSNTNRQYNNSNNNNNRTKTYTPSRTQQPTRTYTPSNNNSNNNSGSRPSSGSSSSGSSSGGSVERPTRGNN